MNKIFKVIYSKTRHCYVVVSELAKSHCKTTQSHTVRSKTALTAAVLLALGAFSFVGMPVAQAADGTESLKNNDYVGANGYYWYFDEKTNQWTKYPYKISSLNNNRSWQELPNYEGGGAKEPGAVTAGLYAQAGEQTVTIGNRNAGQSKGSVFIGELDGYNDGGKNDPVGMKNNYVTAVGFQSNATGWGSIAIGSNAVAENTRETSQVVDYDGNKGTSGTVQDDNYGIKLNPSITGSSVALGYSAKAKDGNIAIGANSDATSTDKNDSYVSVGNANLKRRITNVADGASVSDVATVGQLQALSKELGGYKAGFGIQIDPDSTDKTKNTISLNRNLGRDANTKDKAVLKADENKSALVIGGRVNQGGDATGGQTTEKDYGALGQDSVTVGGADNTASGDAAVVIGGLSNTSSAQYSTVVGGSANDAIGNESSVFGGFNNDANGMHATISGGSHNRTYGDITSVFGGSMNNAVGSTSSVFGGSINTATGIWSSVIGGSHNTALGLSSTAVGGENAIVDGTNSVGIAGGSTNADYALAAGNEATVTVNNGTAIGYQATTDEANTIAFGHDKGDVYYTSTWPQKATKKDGKYYDAQNEEITKDQYEALRNADLTFNDYSQKPKVTENKYDAAVYNRLVKVADGVDAHDVVVMEQLNNAKNDLKVNAGWGIKVNDVTTKNDDNTETTTKNVISLNRNLGTNYGNKYGNGKVTFEADGENSLIIGGSAINKNRDERDKNFTFGAHAKDSALVGGMNNNIDKNSERALIVGGVNNKTLSTNKVQQTGTDAIIVGGDDNKAEGDGSVLIGGNGNEASGPYSMTVGGTGNKNEGRMSSIFGGTSNTIEGEGTFATIFGGENNVADNISAVVVAGNRNHSSGYYSTVLGGHYNLANGRLSTAIGGENNNAIGNGSVVVGGGRNLTSGKDSYASGGLYNNVTGRGASSLGGEYSSVNGILSTGVAGGSTGDDAVLALAAGNQSVVTNSGVEKTYISAEEYNKIESDVNSGKKNLSGDYIMDQSYSGATPEDIRYIHYDKASTALGYQATANQPGTIAFGHDAGDESGYTYEWETLTDENGNPKQNEIDGTTNDYTKAPKSIKKNEPYTSAYYNRLVKVADGIDDHDVVVMEQLKQYAEKDASNIGNNLTVTPVYQTDNQGNIKLGNDNKPLIDEEKTEQKRKDAQTTNKNAWGQALGAEPFTIGTSDAATDASTSDQLVTGKTLYNYDAPVAETGKTLNYVSANNTTGQNLSALDAQVKANADKGLKFAANSGAEYTAKLGSTVKIQGTKKKEAHEYTADNLTTEIDEKGNITILMDKDMSVEKLAVNGKDGKEGAPGTPGSIGIKGQDGESGIGINGKDGISIKGKDGKDGVTMKAVNGENGTEGHIGLTGPAGTNGIKGADGKPGTSIDITVKNGYDGKAGTDGKDGVKGEKGVDGTSLTRIVYEDKTGEHQVATMEDGLKFKGDDTTVINKKLNNTLDIIGGAKGDLTEGNIGVNSTTDGKLKVQLAKDLTDITSISNQKTEGGKTTGAKITLGDDGSVDVNKGKITNVGSGADASGNYTTTTNAANIGDVQKIVKDAVDSAADTTNKALAGKANVDASNIGANLKGEDGKAPATGEEKTKNENAWGSAIGTGKIEKDNGQLVTGKTVYDEVRPTEDGSYVKKNQTTGENLSALDSKIGKLDETKKYNYIDSGKDVSISNNLTKLDTQVKDNADAITNINQSISTLDQNAVKYDDSSKSKISLGGEGGTTITNVKAGVLSENSSDAVNGGQLWQVDQKVDTNTTNITKNAGDITNLKNLSNITDAGKTVIKNLSKDAVQVKAGDRIKVDETTDDKGNKTYTISANNNGTVAKDDGNLISGGTLYNEVHVDKDGTYIKSKDSATGKDMTVAQNLSALDSGLKTTSDLIHTNTAGDTIQIGGNSTATKIDVNGKDGKGRVITGVVSDANDPNSAANVGYVNDVTAASTQQVYRDMNRAYGSLNNNINRAAAGSNALAALHPLDFDPADKASFAFGYGHYRNANAGAFGAFYQPNANTMVNFGITVGNGDPGFNAGVSFKLGQGSPYNGVSKAEMAQTIHDQSEQISAIKAADAAKDKRIDALEKENQEMKKQIQEIMARLNG